MVNNCTPNNLNTLISLVTWPWRFITWAYRYYWPIIVIIMMLITHLLFVFYFQCDRIAINKFVSLVSQLFGGLIILYSINSNLKIVQNKNIVASFKDSFTEFPKLKKPTPKIGYTNIHGSLGLLSRSEGGPKPTTPEERLAFLEKQFAEAKNDIYKLKTKTDELDQRLSKEIQNTNSVVNNIDFKFKEALTGNINLPIFGFLLVIYSAITGFFV